MKRKSASFVLGLVFASGFASSGNLLAQGPAQQTMEARNENPAPAKAATATPAQPDVLFGLIKHTGGAYVLVESATKANYALDDQKKAKHYDGRVVAITGKVNTDSRSMHVQKIEIAG